MWKTFNYPELSNKWLQYEEQPIIENQFELQFKGCGGYKWQQFEQEPHKGYFASPKL